MNREWGCSWFLVKIEPVHSRYNQGHSLGRAQLIILFAVASWRDTDEMMAAVLVYRVLGALISAKCSLF